MNKDTQIEQEIQDKGLDAPRVTPADLEHSIESEHYFTGMDGAESGYPNLMQHPSDPLPSSLNLLAFCVLVLRNGTLVTGNSICESHTDFDAEIGRKKARVEALQKCELLWATGSKSD